jgi:hypothetical protein
MIMTLEIAEYIIGQHVIPVVIHHHQPINISTAEAQTFLMDYPQAEWAITHHAGPVWIGGCN